MEPPKKLLFLVRHAKSSWDDSTLGDEARPLNDRGQTDAPRMGRWLAEQPLQPQVIVSSPAQRARSTAKIIAASLGRKASEIVIDPDIYFRGLRGMLTAIERTDDSIDRLMLVGHNPVMTGLFSELSGEALDNMPTCAIAIIEFPMLSWGLTDTTPGSLLAYQTPKRLAAGASGLLA